MNEEEYPRGKNLTPHPPLYEPGRESGASSELADDYATTSMAGNSHVGGMAPFDNQPSQLSPYESYGMGIAGNHPIDPYGASPVFPAYSGVSGRFTSPYGWNRTGDPQSYGYPARSYSFYPVVSPCDLMMVIRPAVKRGLSDLERKDEKHRFSETAMISYLMGAGFDFRYAEKLVESWDMGEMPTIKENER